MGIGLAIASLLVAVGGAVAQNVQANKTREEQRQQNRKISATNSAKATVARRRALREERVRRAQLVSQAEAGGVGGSSTAISGEALSGTLAAGTIGSIGSSLSATNSLSAGNQSIADSRQREQLFSNVSAIGSSVFSAGGGAGQIDKFLNS